jgi:zinc and cadmium transporter
MGLETLLLILLATIINGLIGLVGIFGIWMKEKHLKKILLILVAFSAGALLSGAFFHMVIESLEMMEAMSLFTYLIMGFIAFFFMERILHWHHCHEGECDVHPFTRLIVLGDGIHNFIDGLVIAASFIVNPWFGWITTLLIITHEIPQELGNFGVLVYGGIEKVRALTLTFIVQLTAIIGGVVGFFFLQGPEPIGFLLPFAAGGFIYIAASDLIPELHKESNLKKSMISFAFFVMGIVFIIGIKLLVGG